MKSQAQRRKLWATNPEVAKEFEAATPKGAKLPERVAKKKLVGKGQSVGVGAFIGNLPPQSQVPMSLQGAMAGGQPNPLMAAPPVMNPGMMPPLPPGLLGTPQFPVLPKKKPVAKRKKKPVKKKKPAGSQSAKPAGGYSGRGKKAARKPAMKPTSPPEKKASPYS